MGCPGRFPGFRCCGHSEVGCQAVTSVYPLEEVAWIGSPSSASRSSLGGAPRRFLWRSFPRGGALQKSL